MWGILVGFAVAVPIGPVGLICIQRTITKNKLSGLISGLGAAVADVLLASVGACSITIIFSFIKEEEKFNRIFSIIYTGAKSSFHTNLVKLFCKNLY